MYQRLLKKARLYHMGINQDDRCPICGTQEETIQHLFFECAFSKQCLHGVLNWMRCRLIKGKRCREIIIAILTTLLYCISKARDNVVWDLKRPTTAYMLSQIKQECRLRKITYLSSKTRVKERDWIEKLLQS